MPAAKSDESANVTFELYFQTLGDLELLEPLDEVPFLIQQRKKGFTPSQRCLSILASLALDCEHLTDWTLAKRLDSRLQHWLHDPRRLVRDGIRLRKRPDFAPGRYSWRVLLIDQRMMELAEGHYADADARRLAQRLFRFRNSLFTFLDDLGVTFDNNLAERMIRPAVLLRKVSLCNRSEKVAAAQAVLLSIYRALKLRGHDPFATITSAVRT